MRGGMNKEKLNDLEKAETFDDFKKAFAALELTQEDREYLAECGIV